VEGATVVEGRKDARGIDGRARDHLHQRHAEQQEFRQHMRQVDHALGAPLRRPVGRDGIGHKALLHGALRDLPGDVPDAPVAEIAPDAAATDRQDLRQHATSVVEHTIGRGRIHVGDDVAALEQGQDGPPQRDRLPDVDHHRQLERCRRLLHPPQRLELPATSDVLRQSCRDPDDAVAVAPRANPTSARARSGISPPGMIPVRAMLMSTRPRFGAACATATTSVMPSAPLSRRRRSLSRHPPDTAWAALRHGRRGSGDEAS